MMVTQSLRLRQRCGEDEACRRVGKTGCPWAVPSWSQGSLAMAGVSRVEGPIMSASTIASFRLQRRVRIRAGGLRTRCARALRFTSYSHQATLGGGAFAVTGSVGRSAEGPPSTGSSERAHATVDRLSCAEGPPKPPRTTSWCPVTNSLRAVG